MNGMDGGGEGAEAAIESCDGVYAPGEDSYLLADAVRKCSTPGESVLDLGTGTGIQGITAALMGCRATFSDIEEKALECARRNAGRNGISGSFVRCDLFEGIDGRYDRIIFNPPYVPSEKVGNAACAEERALLGGKDGREVIGRFLGGYKRHLLPGGYALLVETTPNGYQDDVKNLGAEILAKSHYFFEDIVVLRLPEK
jgi:release factor glutamine methyltransferase